MGAHVPTTAGAALQELFQRRAAAILDGRDECARARTGGGLDGLDGHSRPAAALSIARSGRL
jgi:hypothetical protein